MAKISVLYVDDDHHLLDVCRIYLERTGLMKVETSPSGKDAITRLGQVSYDVIVSDYEMPRMNGLELLTIVREKYNNLPFIIFTGRGREEIVIEAINRGANYYLQKGGGAEAQFTELAHKIRLAVKSHRDELALQNSEEKFRTIFNSVNDAIHIHGIDERGLPTTLVDVNDVACRMLQYSREDMLRMNPLDFAGSYHSKPLDQIGAELKSCGHTVFETGHIRKDGHILPVEISAHRTILNREPVVLSVIRDISERKRQEAALRAEMNLAIALQKVHGLAETLDLCLTSAIEAAALDCGGIYLIDSSTGSVDLAMHRNLGRQFIAALSHYAADSVHVRIVTDKKPAYFPDESMAIVAEEIWSAEGIRSLAAIPVISEDRVVAILDVASHTMDRIPKNSRIIIETIATLIGIVVEKVKAEDTIKRNEIRLESAMEIGNLAWWEMELPSGTVRFDARKAQILGFHAEKFHHYADFTDLLHPQDLEPVMQAMRNHLEGRDPRYHIDYRIRTVSGDYRWFRDIGGITARHPDGAPAVVTGVVIDITSTKETQEALARKHEELAAAFEQLTATEEELRQNYEALESSHRQLVTSEERFRLLFENMAEGCVLHEILFDESNRVIDYRILAANSSYERHLNLRRDTVVGKTSCQAYGTPEAPYLEIYSRVAATGIPETFETYFPPMDKYFWISVYSPQKDRFATIFSDITDEKRAAETIRIKNEELAAAFEELTTAEEELRQGYDELVQSQQELRKSEEQYRRIVETASEGIWAMDTDFRTTFVNSQFARFLGFTPEEMIGKSVYSFLPEEERSDQILKIEERKAGSSGSYERRFLHKDNSVRWGLVSATPVFGYDGSFAGSFAMVTDITAKKCATNALAESEEKFRRVLETALEGIWILDKDFHITFSNARISEILGYPCEEMLGRRVTGFVTSGERGDSEQTMIDLTRGISSRFERRFVRKDGSAVRLQGSATPILGENGEFRGSFFMFTDITARKQMELSLRENEEKFRALIQNSSDILRIVSPDGKILFSSPSTERILGYTPDEIYGHYTTEYVHPGDRKRMKEELALLHQKRGAGIPVEFRLRRKDGSYIEVEAVGGDYIDMRGIAGIVINTRPIAERKRAQEALKKSEERYRNLFKNAVAGIFQFSSDGRLTNANDAFARMFGFRGAEEILGSGIHIGEDLFAVPADFETIIAILQGTGSLEPREFIMKRKDETRFWVLAGASAAQPVDTIIRYYEGICVDITNLRLAEESLLQANRKLNLMTSITRHDILNDITAIQAYLGLGSKITSDPEIQDFFAKIESVTMTIKEQIEFTKVYKNLGTHDPQWQGISESMARLVLPGDINFQNTTGSIEIYADPMLGKVFSNLLDNSLRHGERITAISLSWRTDGGSLILTWEDNGIGIPDDEKEDIFTKGFGRNTGLGLFLVTEILSITGIGIRETGSLGKGVRFEIVVPEGKYRFRSSSGKLPGP